MFNKFVAYISTATKTPNNEVVEAIAISVVACVVGVVLLICIFN